MAHAQAIKNEQPMKHFTDAEVAAVAMPRLSFTSTPEVVKDYEKYFYFHRPDTSFDLAFADITECDALSSGISYYADSSAAVNGAMAQYGVAAGAIGGAIGSAFADLIAGSAERRKIRRTNWRNCMGFKGYSRYGLAKDQWEGFNFEEGNGRKPEAERNRDLMVQARVASGPKPEQEVLEP